MTTVQFSGITFDDQSWDGFHLSKLVGWYDAPAARFDADDRPQGDGKFRQRRVFRSARVVSVEGSWTGDSLEAAYRARQQLAAVQADGSESSFTVTDLLGVRSSAVSLTTAPTADDGLFQPFFKFAFDVVAPDPVKYGQALSQSTTAPTPSSGLVWPLGSTQVAYSWTGTPYQSTSLAKVSGTTTRTNYSTHPSPEDGTTTGYVPNQYGPTGTITVSTDRANTGTRSWKYTAVGGGNGEGFSFTIPSGQRYASVSVFNPTVGGIDHLGITGIPSTGQQTAVTRTTIKGAWVRLSIDMGGTTGGTVVVYNDDTPATAGQVFYWDDVLIGDQGDYFDGASAPTGSFFNWGTAGNPGQVSLANPGTAQSWPTLTVTGGLSGGFVLTWVPTGDRLVYSGPIPDGSSVNLNARTGRATMNGASDVTGFLTTSNWWALKPGQTGLVQFTPVGTQTGTPTLTGAIAPGYL